MNEKKWTPGPWRVETDDVGGSWVESSESYGLVICEAPDTYFHLSREAWGDNRNLIAASPDLYEVSDSPILRELIGIIEDTQTPAMAPLWSLAVQWMELRDAALAKARGERHG